MAPQFARRPFQQPSEPFAYARLSGKAQQFIADRRRGIHRLPDGVQGATADLSRRPEIDALNDAIFPSLNNGVYRAAFATTQAAYDEAFADVFGMLDTFEERLAANGPFLFGRELTETDIRLFVTLVRFDAAYYGPFKYNLRRIADYTILSGYLARMLAVPGIRETVSIGGAKAMKRSAVSMRPPSFVWRRYRRPACPGIPRRR